MRGEECGLNLNKAVEAVSLQEWGDRPESVDRRTQYDVQL